MRNSIVGMLITVFLVVFVSACGSGGGSGSQVTSPSTNAAAQMNLVSFSTSTSTINVGSTFHAQWSVSGQSYNGLYGAKLYIDTANDAATKTGPTLLNKLYDASCAFDGSPLASLYSCGSNVTLNCSYNSTSSRYFACSLGTGMPQTINIPISGSAYVILEACVMDSNTYQNICSFQSVPIVVN